jgi:hypothetical protein
MTEPRPILRSTSVQWQCRSVEHGSAAELRACAYVEASE